MTAAQWLRCRDEQRRHPQSHASRSTITRDPHHETAPLGWIPRRNGQTAGALGALQRPARGVYVTHARELTGLELGHAAAALAGDRVVLSGLVVVRELGLRWVPSSPGVLALVDAEVRTPSSGRITLRRTRQVDALQTWRRDGLELAPAERAVIDAARELSNLRDVRGVVLGAVADRWATPADLRIVLDGTARNGSGLVGERSPMPTVGVPVPARPSSSTR